MTAIVGRHDLPTATRLSASRTHRLDDYLTVTVTDLVSSDTGVPAGAAPATEN
jgi:hypothetical protein